MKELLNEYGLLIVSAIIGIVVLVLIFGQFESSGMISQIWNALSGSMLGG